MSTDCLSAQTVPHTDNYAANLFAKPLIVLDEMHQHPESEWFFFLDDDVYFNPSECFVDNVMLREDIWEYF
jgi:hypothetical protein